MTIVISVRVQRHLAYLAASKVILSALRAFSDTL